MSIPQNLHQRPFLAPIGLAALAAMLGVLVLIVVAWVFFTADSTTIIVVRHAEKVLDDGPDPPLTAEGRARAELLAHMLGSSNLKERVDAIYVSATVRSRATAAPLAARVGLAPVVIGQEDARATARRVLREHSGGRVVLVGHADTIPAIVATLSGARDIPPMGAADYGTMYIVTVPRIGRASMFSLQY